MHKRYTVHQLAKLAGISVRTLHYYDEVGLLEPSFVADNGYRYYEERELIRLQQILFYRELDFSLDDIKYMLSRPGFSIVESLRDQKKLLLSKRKRLDGLITTITKTITTMTNQQKMQDEEMYDAFKDNDVKEYQAEVKERWGNTDAYRQSVARVSKMTKQQMDTLKADGIAHTKKLAESMDKGFNHPEVQTLIAEHHKGINFFYECNYVFYRNLSDMYVNDPRFTAYYDKHRPGLAEFVRDAIHFYCDVHEGKR